MHIYAVVVLSFLISSMAFAQNQGVEATNYSLGVAAVNSDYSRDLALSVSAKFPIYGYAGGEIAGDFSDSNGKDNYLDSSSYSGSASLFLKKHDLGLILASFERTHKKVDSAYPNSSFNWDSYLLAGTYYYEDFNFYLGRSGSKVDTSGESFYKSFIGASYFLNNNFLLGATASDDDGNSKTIYVSFQPEALNNSIVITGSYGNSDSDSDSDTDDTFLISLDYSFDLNVSLKDKARKY